MKWVTSESVAAAELAAAQFIAQQLMQAVHERGRATFAISGGRTPWCMLGTLAAQEVNWGAVHLLQVDVCLGLLAVAHLVVDYADTSRSPER